MQKLDKEILKNFTILYVEDDESIRASAGAIFKKVFKEVILCVDGQDGLDKYKESLANGLVFHAVVSDINMPRMNGIEMLKEIKKLDSDLPFIMTTAHTESNFLMDAIALGVTHYATKPMNTFEVLNQISDIASIKFQQKIIQAKEKELSSYKSVMDDISSYIKVDLNGKILESNSFFREISGYDTHELLKGNMNDVLHNNTISTSFKTLEAAINNADDWEGTLKFIDKDDNVFYLRCFAFPKLNFTDEVASYTLIGFSVTEEEMKKRELNIKTIRRIAEERLNAGALAKQIKDMEKEKSKKVVKNDEIDNSAVHASLNKASEKIKKLLVQTDAYELEIKQLTKRFSATYEKNAEAKRVAINEKIKTVVKQNKKLEFDLLDMTIERNNLLSKKRNGK